MLAVAAYTAAQALPGARLRLSQPAPVTPTQKETPPCAEQSRCKTCGKTTWAGCGQHVGQVKAGVPAKDWCNGQHTPAEKAAAGSGGGFLSKIFGR